MRKKDDSKQTIAVHEKENFDTLYGAVKKIIETARADIHRAVNTAMVEAYWHIGKMIVEEEQNSKNRAEYGTTLIQNLSDRLIAHFGKGFSAQNIWNMRLFYQKFSAVQRELQGNPENGILERMTTLRWGLFSVPKKTKPLLNIRY